MLAIKMRPTPGDLINGKYRLLRLIGDGGMGSVYEARHEFLGTSVALKFLHPELARRQGLVARFLQEARLAASIHSPHIAHVTDVDQAADGAAYLVMELLQGESLASLLDRERRLTRDVALDYTLQVLAGLEAAHAIGAVHRDLKPDNVFVVSTPHGPWVKLLDFGIAKLRTSREFQVGLTRPGMVMGTPEYMAPEQAFSAESVDVRADLYAVGVMLFEMLTGERPLQGDDAREIAARVMAQNFANVRQIDPTIPEQLAQIVHRAMAPIPAHRFASAGEMRDALSPWCGALSVAGKLAATPTPPPAGMAPAAALAAAHGGRASPEGGASHLGMARSLASGTSAPGASTPGKVRSGTQPDQQAVAATLPKPTETGAGAAPRLALASTASMPGFSDLTGAPPVTSLTSAGQAGGPAPAASPLAGGGSPGPLAGSGGAGGAVPQAGVPLAAGAAAVRPKGSTAPMPAMRAYGPGPHTQQAAPYVPQAYGAPPSPASPVPQNADSFGAQIVGAPGAQAGGPYAQASAYSPVSPVAGTSYVQPSMVTTPGRPTRTGGPRGVSLGVWAALAGAAGVIVVVAVMAFRPSRGTDSHDSHTATAVPTHPVSMPTAVQVPQAQVVPSAQPAVAVIPPAVQPTPAPAPAPPPQPTTQGTATSSKPPVSKPRDAGATIPIWDGGLTLPPLPLPPLPSQLPIPAGLPTTFPFPLPGFPGAGAATPATANSQ